LQATFVDDEIVHEIDSDGNVIGGGGSALVNGATAPNNTDLLDGSVQWKYIGLGAGVVMRTAAYLRDCSINSTSGNGLHVEAQSRECPQSVCNANGWGFNTLTSFSCQGHNVFVRGSDSNGGWGIGGYFLGGGGPTSDGDFTGPGVNICDMSFLGNTYVSIQFGSGGQGPIVSKSVGGGNTFVGCYVEGTGGGWSESSGTCTIVGGGLAVGTLWKPGSNPAQIGPAGGRGLSQTIYGSKGFTWLHSTVTPLGWRVLNDGNKCYQCITPGTTASSGGPTGTGSDITDGTVHWAYISPFVTDGQVGLGSVDGAHPSALNFQWPDAVGFGQGWNLSYDTATKGGHQVTKVGTLNYGDPTRTALMLSDNYTELAEWPSWVPAGNSLMFETWIGGTHIMTGTAAPTSGNWNRGDLILYKGTAVVVGGNEGLKCTTPGTAGTYSGGRTLTSSGGTLVTVSGSLMQTLRSGQDFHTGDYLTIDSISTQVTSVAADGMSLGLANTIPAGTYSPVFTNPVFTPFGIVSNGPGVANVLDFGADPTGSVDSSPAFLAAINSFSGSGSSVGGEIVVPPGNYRFSSSVHIKKSVHIKGSKANYYSTRITADVGVTAFTFERYNTPRGTTDAGSGDGASISGIYFTHASKASVWLPTTGVTAGDVRKVGPAPSQGAILLGDNQPYGPYPHYICTQSGTTGSFGPHSLGGDRTLLYKTQTSNFTVGQYVTGSSSGAFGIIIADADAGATGTLRLTGISGAFTDNEVLTDPIGGAAVANGADIAPATDEVDGTAR